MACEGLFAEPDDYANGMTALFQSMSGRVQRLMPESAGLRPLVDNVLETNQWGQALQRRMGAASKAAQALECERLGELSTARALWRDLLGPDSQRG